LAENIKDEAFAPIGIKPLGVGHDNVQVIKKEHGPALRDGEGGDQLFNILLVFLRGCSWGRNDRRRNTKGDRHLFCFYFGFGFLLRKTLEEKEHGEHSLC
jgi:hypothetical protein